MNDATLWAAARDLLFEVEGGYVNHPDDPGGETNFGISKRSYPNEDIRNMTRERATVLYDRDYWSRIPADAPGGVRWFAFDCAVHHGASRALAWLAPDDMTLARFATLERMTATRLTFMAGLTTWPSFGRGWARRVARVLAGIATYEAQHGHATGITTVELRDWAWLDRLRGVFEEPIIARGHFVAHERDARLIVTRE